MVPSQMQVPLYFLFLAPLAKAQDSSVDSCSLPMDLGTPINGTSGNHTIKYYYDSEIAMCFKYRHEGGTVGPNSFDSEELCRLHCIPADFFTCGGNVPSTGQCSHYEQNAEGCPSGSICKNGAMFGLCCPKETEDVFQKEYTPQCPSGSTVVKEKVWWGEDVLRGRSCSHNFCPEGTECKAGKWIAYCCRNSAPEAPKL